MLASEDQVEVERGTQLIVPKCYIKYILPRFVVVNSDTTRRSINNCTSLGPFTTTFHFRLPTPDSLQYFQMNDIILALDGKSAYRQRKLCWADRNKIGFRTQINGKVVHVAMATHPFGLHNSGYIYQKNLEAKMKRTMGRHLWLEYIDDLAIKIGSKHQSPEKIQWMGSMVIWILTKKGEILNDKFFVFKDILTMLGVNFNLNCGTFIPKLNSLYKFMIQLSSLLNKRDVKVSQLQELIGKFTWIIRDRRERVCLKPIHKYIGSLVKKFKPKNSLQYKHLSYKTIPWNKRLLMVCFDMLWAIKTAFLNFNMPIEMSDGSVLEIITDSNPLVAGGVHD